MSEKAINTKVKEKENLSEMISISFTPTQEEALERATEAAGFDKVGTHGRWIIVKYLKENGFLASSNACDGDE